MSTAQQNADAFRVLLAYFEETCPREHGSNAIGTAGAAAYAGFQRTRAEALPGRRYVAEADVNWRWIVRDTRAGKYGREVAAYGFDFAGTLAVEERLNGA